MKNDKIAIICWLWVLSTKKNNVLDNEGKKQGLSQAFFWIFFINILFVVRKIAVFSKKKWNVGVFRVERKDQTSYLHKNATTIPLEFLLILPLNIDASYFNRNCILYSYISPDFDPPSIDFFHKVKYPFCPSDCVFFLNRWMPSIFKLHL